MGREGAAAARSNEIRAKVLENDRLRAGAGAVNFNENFNTCHRQVEELRARTF